MLIKNSDNRDKDISELRLLLEYDISAKQRFLVERELKFVSSGMQGEESSAYYIDFHYKNSERWVVIHDLRLEHQGFVAQIDHLLINRFLDIYVLESKNYYYGIKITPEGEFLAWNGKTFIGIESPIEQNRRHINLLEKKLAMWQDIMPTRLGIPITATFYNYVLVAANSRIDRPPSTTFNTSMVIKADSLFETIGKRVDGMGVAETFASAAKMISVETLETVARSLVKLHRPAKIDYASKFGINVQKEKSVQRAKQEVLEPADNVPKTEHSCQKCGAKVDSKVVNFCRFNKDKFGGKILCRSCQQTFSAGTNTDKLVEPLKTVKNADKVSKKEGICEGCGTTVDSKVIFFAE